MSKVRFLSAGSINVIFTVLFLQIFLAYSLPVWLSTLLAQLFNISFGFCVNSRYVFRVRQASIYKYGAVNLALWGLNTLLIEVLSLSEQISVNIASVIILLPIGFLSYVVQKKWVFYASSIK